MNKVKKERDNLKTHPSTHQSVTNCTTIIYWWVRLTDAVAGEAAAPFTSVVLKQQTAGRNHTRQENVVNAKCNYSLPFPSRLANTGHIGCGSGRPEPGLSHRQRFLHYYRER